MYCPNPFDRLEIKADGSVYCCCEGWLPKPLGNILSEDLMSIWKSQPAKEIRTSILDGSFRFCESCPYRPGPAGPIVEKTPEIPSRGRITTLKLDYDQTCNLTCPSCRTTHSRNFVDAARARTIHEAVMNSGILDVVNTLYVTGAGDPIASPLYWSFLKTLHERDLSKNPDIRVFLHTNGLLLDEKHWQELGPTRDRVSDIGISIDAATEPTYREIRQASWHRLWSNIAFINRLRSEGKSINLGFFYTVQDHNFRELPTFVQMARDRRVQWISITALRNWGTYSDDDYRKRAVHLPDHPDHAEFREMLARPELNSTGECKIVMDSFDPAHANQETVIAAGALLPEKRVRKR